MKAWMPTVAGMTTRPGTRHPGARDQAAKRAGSSG